MSVPRSPTFRSASPKSWSRSTENSRPSARNHSSMPVSRTTLTFGMRTSLGRADRLTGGLRFGVRTGTRKGVGAENGLSWELYAPSRPTQLIFSRTVRPEAHRRGENDVRPRGALGNRMPTEFAAQAGVSLSPGKCGAEGREAQQLKSLSHPPELNRGRQSSRYLSRLSSWRRSRPWTRVEVRRIAAYWAVAIAW